MKKDDQVYVGHMLDTARLILTKVAAKSRDEYDANEDLRLALAYLIQTLGEAARHVSDEFQQAHPKVPWKKIIAMRHKIVHDYLHVDFDLVWDVVKLNIPELITQLEEVVGDEH